MAIGDLAARLGDTQLAATAFTAAIDLVPSLAGDPWWQADPLRAAAFPQLVDAAIAAATAGRSWEIALMAGDADRARALASAVSSVGATLIPEDVIAAWEGDDGALDRVLAACNAHPLDSTLLAWAARLEHRRGDIELANRYLQWAYAFNSDAAAIGLRAACQRPPDARPNGSGLRGRVLGCLHVPSGHAVEPARSVRRAAHPRICE